MPKPYVKVVRWDSYRNDYLEFSDGKDKWMKLLIELTSYIGAHKTEKEANECKKRYCDNISECIGMPFTVEDLDKIVTKSDYRFGAYALAEFTHIVETNIKAVEQGKEPVYKATSIAGSKIMDILEKEINANG